ncbi:MAG: hypothetical protein P8Z33_00980 [Gammaproteobacteria bacterium]
MSPLSLVLTTQSAISLVLRDALSASTECPALSIGLLSVFVATLGGTQPAISAMHEHSARIVTEFVDGG